MEVRCLENSYVTFSEFGDEVVYTKPVCQVRNLIFGEMTLDIIDQFSVKNSQGDECEITLVPYYVTGKPGNLHGTVKNLEGEIVYKIEGNWLESIRVVDEKRKSEKTVWKIIPSAGKENYYFQPISFDLNNLTEEMKIKLPRTDSRFRKDQRFMEAQDIEAAAEEKERLESKQRLARKEDKKKNIINKPRYFEETYDDLTGDLIYVFKGNYFDDRKNGRIDDAPDLFG